MKKVSLPLISKKREFKWSCLLLSKDFLHVLSYLDQEFLIKLQVLSNLCYHRFLPSLLILYIFERPYVHLYLANRKRFLVCFLDNLQAVEMPQHKKVIVKEETPRIALFGQQQQKKSQELESYIEDTPRIGFKIPDSLQFFTTVQYF
jgi:hypothetical protein